MDNNVVVNHLDGEYGLINKINNAMKEAADQFIYIGFLLKEADDFKYYEEAGYNNIYDFCEDKFGFGRSSTNNFIRVYRQFGSKNGIALLDSFKAYSYSQLTEMCSMNMKQLNECNPYMTVKELRAVKHGTTKIDLESFNKVKSISVQTSGQITSYFKIGLHHLSVLERYLFDRFSGNKYYDSLDSLQSFVCNTGSNFSFEISGEGIYPVSVFCYANCVTVDFNGDIVDIPYSVVYYIYDVLAQLKKSFSN